MTRRMAGGSPGSVSRRVLGMNGRNRNMIDLLNHRLRRRFADDKALTKEIWERIGLPVPRTYAVVDSMRDAGRILDVVGELEHFVIKPAHGRAGGGIAVLGPRSASGWRHSSGEIWREGDIRRRLGDIITGGYARQLSDRALIEERLFPGAVLGEMQVVGLPDVRVITLYGDSVMAMVRLPTRQSDGKANLHLGAIGLGVDLQTGLTTTATWRHRPLTVHPESHLPLSGLPVAAWDRVLQIAQAAAKALPLHYLGIDIAVTRDRGPILLEANVRPGLEIQNANQKGLGPELERILARRAPGENNDEG